MKTYPVMLKLEGRHVVVVGAGSVGQRKVRSLTAAGARVKLIDPNAEVPPGQDNVEMVRAEYSPDMLDGAFLVFACTDNTELNSQVAADAAKTGSLVNVADVPDECDFFAPAVITRGPVVAAIGTGGSCPALAAELKKRIADAIDPTIGEFAELLADCRNRLASFVTDQKIRAEILGKLSSAQTLEEFRRRGQQAMDELFEQLTSDLDKPGEGRP